MNDRLARLRNLVSKATGRSRASLRREPWHTSDNKPGHRIIDWGDDSLTHADLGIQGDIADVVTDSQ